MTGLRVTCNRIAFVETRPASNRMIQASVGLENAAQGDDQYADHANQAEFGHDRRFQVVVEVVLDQAGGCPCRRAAA